MSEAAAVLERGTGADPQLDTRLQTALFQALAWVKAEPGRSERQLCDAAGMSQAVFVQLKRGGYPGDVDKMVRKLEDFLNLENARLTMNMDPPFVETRQARMIHGFAFNIQVRSKIGVVFGPAGVGKTEAVRAYQRGRTNVRYVKANPFMTGKTAFLRALLDEFDLPFGSSAVMAFKKLATVAAEQQALIIIDDSQVISGEEALFNTTNFETIRALNDLKVPVMLVGNYALRNKVTTNEKEAIYQQMQSRVEVLEAKDEFSREDCLAIAEGLIERKLPDDCATYLVDQANKHVGALRVAVAVLQLAAMRAHMQRVPLTLRHLEDASRYKIAPLKGKYAAQGGKINGGE